MPPRRLKKRSVKRLVEKRVAKAIEEYKKSRANPDSAGSSGGNTMNTRGTVNVQGCLHKTFMNVKPHSFNGTEGVVGFRRWIEKVEQVFEISKCTEEDKVMFAASTFEGSCVNMKIERYVRGFPERIKGNITSSKPATLHDAINMARELVEQAVQGRATRIGESNKRKWEDHQRNTNNNNHNNHNNNNNNNRNRNNNYHQQQNRRQETARAYAAAPAEGRGYAGRKSTKVKRHFKDKCPKGRNQPNEGAHRRATWWLKIHSRIRMSRNGIHVDPSKVESVKNWKIPESSTEICLFLGLAGYYRRFIENFSKIAKPLTLLTQKNKTYVWGDKQDEGFRHSEGEAMQKLLFLGNPDGPSGLVVYCDARKQVTKLPRSSSGYDAIWVVVDRLTKSAHFLPIREHYKTEKLERIYINKIVARNGVPVSIISDRDGRFASHLWQALLKALGTKLNMSTAYHPETDGQSERTIQTLEDMLRACIMDFGGSWDTHLPLVEFSYNNRYHKSIKCAPFEALYGKKCRSPVIWTEVGESQLIGPEIVQETTEKIVQIKDRLKTTRSSQKSYADKRRKPLEFKVGDRILLKVSPWKGVVRFGKKEKLAP
ncbi:putative reverse transcriptase domain-containing protein [Tanacetum coccineum]